MWIHTKCTQVKLDLADRRLLIWEQDFQSTVLTKPTWHYVLLLLEHFANNSRRPCIYYPFTLPNVHFNFEKLKNRKMLLSTPFDYSNSRRGSWSRIGEAVASAGINRFNENPDQDGGFDPLSKSQRGSRISRVSTLRQVREGNKLCISVTQIIKLAIRYEWR